MECRFGTLSSGRSPIKPPLLTLVERIRARLWSRAQGALVNQARRLAKSEGGAALVEFAVILPVLALLLTGLIDFGRYMYDGIVAANAARAGAQYGAQNLFTAADTTGMKNAALQDAQNLANLSATPSSFCMSGSTVVTCGTAGAVAYVQVNTTGTFTPLIKYPGLPATVNLSGSAVLRVVQQ
jgi:Flp pilus assembly protein TadG